METVVQDIRYGLRTLKKNPGFTAVVVFTLAVGIAVNAAVFSVFNALLLRPLPFPKPDRLVALWEIIPQFTGRTSVSHPNFLDWKDQSQLMERMAAFNYDQANLSGAGEPERIRVVWASEEYFSVLGISPTLGRVFSPEEYRSGTSRVAILSQGFWQRRFGVRSDILGQSLILDGNPYNVVAVMQDVTRDYEPDVYLPLHLDVASSRGNFALSVIGRLKPHISVEQAQAEMTIIAGRLERQYPDVNKGVGVVVTSLHADRYGDQYRQIWISSLTLMAAVGFVLLIACSNVANLLLARASARGREMAVRTALGAGRRRVIRQLMTESLQLAVLGGCLGLLLSYLSCHLMNAYFLDANLGIGTIQVDVRVMAFTLAVCLGTALMFGLLPAFQTARVKLNDALKESGRSSSAGSDKHRLNRLLVISEVTLACVLLIGAGLLIKGFNRLLGVFPGFRQDHTLTMQFSLAGERYKEERGRRPFFQQVLNRVSVLPGVQAAGLISDIPMSSGSNSVRSFTIEGRPTLPGETLMENFQVTSPDYFKALSIPLMSGRFFTEADNEKAPPVMVISEGLAAKYWKHEDPIGKRLNLERALRTIVGIVGDIQPFDLTGDRRPQMYLPYLQHSEGNLGLVVRTAVDPLSLVTAIKSQIQALDAQLPITRVRSLEKVITDRHAAQQFLIYLMGIFALIALLLAAVGLYGVMAYSVSQRTREIGIRLALGACHLDVLRAVIIRGIGLTLIGLGLGLALAFALMRSISSMLFGLSPNDPLIFTAVPVLLAMVAIAASYIPARRATRVDPIMVLRYE